METNKEILDDFWKSIGFEQGTNRIVINYGQSQTYMNDFFLLNQNGKYYIHDKKNNKMYDQELNYYQDGRYYNRKGEIIQDIPNDNIIDVNPDEVYKVKPNNTIEHFDSNGNPYKLTAQEAFDKYGPNDDRFYTSQGLDPVEQRKKIDELNSKRKPVKTDKEILDDISVKPEEYEKLEKEYESIANDLEKLKNENIAEEVTEEIIENTNKELPKKKLTKPSAEALENINFKKVGKIGLVAAAIGIGAYAIGNHNKNKENQQTQRQVQYPQNNSYIDNSYAQQMASDISSYKYGKHMTGFVN